MREFAQYEMRKSKCPICGCRNKLFTRFTDKVTNDKVGYTITCCNCGKVQSFFKDVTKNGTTPIYTRKEYQPTLQRCFQLSGCSKNKECPLYGTSCDKLHNGCYGNCVECDGSSCETGNCKNDGNSNGNSSDNSTDIINRMSVHIHNTPRFL